MSITDLSAAMRVQVSDPALLGYLHACGVRKLGLPAKQTLPDRPSEFTHPTRLGVSVHRDKGRPFRDKVLFYVIKIENETLVFAGSLERMKGLEPSTFCMASRRSSQLSYIRERNPS